MAFPARTPTLHPDVRKQVPQTRRWASGDGSRGKSRRRAAPGLMDVNIQVKVPTPGRPGCDAVGHARTRSLKFCKKLFLEVKSVLLPLRFHLSVSLTWPTEGEKCAQLCVPHPPLQLLVVQEQQHIEVLQLHKDAGFEGAGQVIDEGPALAKLTNHFERIGEVKHQQNGEANVVKTCVECRKILRLCRLGIGSQYASLTHNKLRG
jgi:hypothetical protein